jgi:imidazolonepropionase-like amidohydrolase
MAQSARKILSLALPLCFTVLCVGLGVGPGVALAAAPPRSRTGLPPGIRPYVVVAAPAVALEHVWVLDGTGRAERQDQTVILAHGRIVALGPAAAVHVPANVRVLNLRGDTVIPGLVGMHDHMFYPAGRRLALYNEQGYSFPRLYLAAGVTTLRTTGAVEPYTDLALRHWIAVGRMPGPDIIVTGPYLEGAGAYTPNMHELTGPADATRTVDYWAAEGFHTFKAYMHITRAELAAAIAAAHAHHATITGHLCAVGFQEAARLGIDDLEHGLLIDTEFDPGKRPNVCPPQAETARTLSGMHVSGARIQRTLQVLVRRHVALTSTLPVFETFAPHRPPLESRVLLAMSPEAQVAYLAVRRRIGEQTHSPWPALLRKEMEFERDFARMGGLLMAGEDPTGYGGDLAGFGDQREMELLVRAGFSPAQAVQIYSENGARFLGMARRIGTLAPGKAADVVVVRGNLGRDIAAIEQVQLVFKDGLGYSPAKLLASVRGTVGRY